MSSMLCFLSQAQHAYRSIAVCFPGWTFQVCRQLWIENFKNLARKLKSWATNGLIGPQPNTFLLRKGPKYQIRDSKFQGWTTRVESVKLRRNLKNSGTDSKATSHQNRNFSERSNFNTILFIKTSNRGNLATCIISLITIHFSSSEVVWGRCGVPVEDNLKRQKVF
jgi:hypothetical protein